MNEVTFPLTRDMQGTAVADLHQALLALFQASSLFGGDPAALQEAKAALAQELDEESYGPYTAKIVAQFQEEQRLDPTGVVDKDTARALNDALQGLGGPQPAGSQSTLGGVIRYEHGLPAEELRLRLYRREFGGKATQIAETVTQAGGRYTFALDARDQVASLEIRAVTNVGKEVRLSKPLNHLTAENRGRVNLVAPAKLQPLAAEYQRLRADLGPHVGEMGKLAEATEDAERQDLTVLRRATGWDARLIGLAAVTERLAADPEVKLAPEGLYGLLRVGLPSNKRLLAQVRPEVVEMALEKAQTSGVVGLSEGERAAFTKQFNAFAARTRLLLPAPGSSSSYGELLRSSGLSEEAQQMFAAAYLKHGGDGAELWNEARAAGLSGQDVRTLQLQGKFAFLAGNSAAMTARLLKKGLTEPAQLPDRDLFEATKWREEVLEEAEIPKARWGALSALDQERLEAVVPAAYPGERVEGRLDAYAADLARKVRLSYPTQVLGRLMEKDPKFALPTGHDVTLKLLKNATAQGFRLGETPVSRFLRERPNVDDGLTEAEFKEAQDHLGMLARVYQITPSNEAMPVLMSLGMTAAYDVMAYTQEEFIAIFRDKYHDLYHVPAPVGVPELVYQKAQQVSSVTYNLFAIAKKLAGELPVAGLSAPVQARESARNELIKHFPTMESLFGSMDYCDCEHCRSVLSPAAYLVDLLQFVDSEPSVWANFLAHWSATHGSNYPHPKPYDVLVERRPDLPHLALTCENTHTALPYIDIVNEILEYEVANGRLAKEAARDTDESSTAELLAEPQNVIREAYDSLRSASFPLNLPFDLWLETVRKFCDYFETPLHRVLEVLLPEQDLLIRIQAPTNVGQATVDVANSDAARLRTGLSVTHRSANTSALSGEWQRITVVGADDSGGAGWSTITFGGTWGAAPAAGDLLVVRPLEGRATVFMESLGLAPAEVELFSDPEPLTNDRWHRLYGLPAVRGVIGGPTNAGQATLTLPNADGTCLAA